MIIKHFFSRSIAQQCFALFFFAAFFFSCTKPEGEGGKSSITGKVYCIDYADELDNKLDTFPAKGEDVYIVYGSGSQQDDDCETNYEGEFKFEYLQPGNYSIFVYGNDPDASELQNEQLIEISLGKKEDYLSEDIYLYTSKDGHSTVSGKLFIKDYDSYGLPKGIEYFAGDVDVYICRQGADFYFDKTKTHYDGTFSFPKLRRGDYYVYAYSKDISTLPPSEIPIIESKEFSITDFAQTVDLDSLVIIN